MASQRQRRPPRAGIAHWSAPVGGWNSIDSIAQMPPTDCVQLDNLIPTPGIVRCRRGSQQYIAGTQVSSLMVYSGAPATGERLVAATNTNQLLDITNPTGVTAIFSNATNLYWQSTMFSTPGGQYLVMCNGADPEAGQALTWAGTGAAVATTFTAGPSAPSAGLPPFSMVANYSARLWFCSDVDLNLYYTDSVLAVLGGQVDAINLGQYFPKGGQIAFLCTWTRDDTIAGMMDMLVIGTTMGEVAVYQGYDPSTAGDFTLQGVFDVGRPVGGHRQVCRMGADMMLICEDGFQSLANYLALGQSKALTTAISRKIGNAVTLAVKQTRTVSPGWDAVLYPAENTLLVNVPQIDGSFQQYVVNTITGAWCRFLGLQAQCWCVWRSNLYFGAANGVWQADTGQMDGVNTLGLGGVPITFELVTAFQTLGNPVMQKTVGLARPIYSASGPLNIVMDVSVDYFPIPPTAPLDPGDAGLSQWVPASPSSAGLWWQPGAQPANWAYSEVPVLDWYSVQGLGSAFALHLVGSSLGSDFNLYAFDLTYQSGMGFI